MCVFVSSVFTREEVQVRCGVGAVPQAQFSAVVFPMAQCLASLAQRDKCRIGLLPEEPLCVPPVYHLPATGRSEISGVRASLYHTLKVLELKRNFENLREALGEE